MVVVCSIKPTSNDLAMKAFACITYLLSLHRLNAFAPPSLLPHRNRITLHATPAATSSNTSLASTYDLIVIGGGSAGLTAAKFVSNFGKTVCIVESSRVGGDCTWTGCVPSKTLLSAAKRAWTWRQMNEKYGQSSVDDASLRNMLRSVKKEVDDNRNRIYEEDDSPGVLSDLGIDFAEGRAYFRDGHSVNVTNESDGATTQINAKYGIVIATGAAPGKSMFDIVGLDYVPFWTYENVWDEGGFFDAIEQIQQGQVSKTRVIVVGGGPIGCELSQAISRLGCSVVLVSRSPRLLPQMETEASVALQEVFEKEGIDVICNQRIVSVTLNETGTGPIMASLESHEPIFGDHILIATGRVPNIQNMGLDEIGVKINPDTNGIRVNEKLQTSVKGVYAAGDCTGDRQFTHYAGFQGAIAARNILLPLKDDGVLIELPSTTFTDPEVASFGLTEQAASDKYGENAVSVSLRPLAKIDRAICEGTGDHGFIKIVYKTRTKQILGATIMSPAAGELVSELSAVQAAKMPFDKLATVMHSYPSYSIALQQMAAEVYYDKLKKGKALYDVLKKAGL